MIDRSRLPAVGPSPPFTFPGIERSTLSSGLRVWTIGHAEIPVVTFALLILRGAAADPTDKPGLAATTADMLDEGSGERSALEMHEAIARLGAQLETDIAADAMVIGLTVLGRFADRALALLADTVVRPALREDDFGRVRQLRLNRLTQLRDIPGAVADRAFFKLLYGDQPYGHTPVGTEQALASMTVDDVRAFHGGAIRPSAAILIAVGALGHEDVRRLAGDAFAGWEGEAAEVALERSGAPGPRCLSVIPRASAPQSELRIGQVAAARSTSDYHALLAGNMVLGGQFSSRLNLNLRERKGVTYGARTAFDFRRAPGPFVLQASVQTSATAESIQESLREIDAIVGASPVTADELRLAVAALTRGYVRNFETAEQIARAAMQLALYDLPETYFSDFVRRVEQLTADEVTGAMARHIDTSRLTTVVVGDEAAIGVALSRLDIGEPVVVPAGTF